MAAGYRTSALPAIVDVGACGTPFASRSRHSTARNATWANPRPGAKNVPVFEESPKRRPELPVLNEMLRRVGRRGTAAFNRSLQRPAAAIKNPTWLRGDFESWRDAVGASGGYDSQ